MKNLLKLPVIGLFIVSMLISGCSNPIDNLGEQEKELFSLSEESEKQINKLNIALQNSNPDYSNIKEIATKTRDTLDRNVISIEKLKMEDRASQLAKNAVVIIKSSNKINNKIIEFAIKADTYQNSSDTETVTQQEFDAILKGLNGYQLRINQSETKLQNLKEELLKLS